MRLLGNIIWFLIGGIEMAFAWFLAGCLLSITVIGLPLGLQCFKIAGFVMWPFGRNVTIGEFGVGGLLFNIIWLIFFGWELAIAHVFTGLFFTITIIGIPFGKQHFKLASLALLPFGAKVS